MSVDEKPEVIALDDYSFFCGFLRERSGISLNDGKAYLVEARMRSVLSDSGIDGFPSLVRALRVGTDRALCDQVVEAMTTNETSFFRDSHPFNALKTEIIPKLLEERETARKLQIWSAGCSSGQEPYSIAMIILASFPELAEWTLSIVGTDLSNAVLEQARAGSYSQLEVNRGLPAPLLARFFQQKGIRWQIAKELRDMMEYRKLNLLEPFCRIPPADIVFMRNVLIYFEVEQKREILARVRKLMNPGGYLFLGGAESTMNLEDGFERIDPPRAGCYRLKES